MRLEYGDNGIVIIGIKIRQPRVVEEVFRLTAREYKQLENIVIKNYKQHKSDKRRSR